MRFAAWCSLSVGALMLAQWTFFLAAGQAPELQSEPVAFAFHLVAEFATAAALIVSAVLILRGHPGSVGLGLVANGMLIYTVIVSPGYFAELGQWPLVAMFAALLVLAVASTAQLLGSLRGGAV